jgi:chromosome segregation ATPase
MPILCLMIAGCAVIKMRSENKQAEQRIAVKEQEFKELEQRRVEIESEKERLLSELKSKQMTLDELFDKLEKLEEKIKRLRLDSEKMGIKKHDFEKRIQDYKAQIRVLQADEQVSPENKTKRIEELKEEIRSYLKMGLDKK